MGKMTGQECHLLTQSNQQSQCATKQVCWIGSLNEAQVPSRSMNGYVKHLQLFTSGIVLGHGEFYLMQMFAAFCHALISNDPAY